MNRSTLPPASGASSSTYSLWNRRPFCSGVIKVDGYGYNTSCNDCDFYIKHPGKLFLFKLNGFGRCAIAEGCLKTWHTGGSRNGNASYRCRLCENMNDWQKKKEYTFGSLVYHIQYDHNKRQLETYGSEDVVSSLVRCTCKSFFFNEGVQTGVWKEEDHKAGCPTGGAFAWDSLKYR